MEAAVDVPEVIHVSALPRAPSSASPPVRSWRPARQVQRTFLAAGGEHLSERHHGDDGEQNVAGIALHAAVSLE